MTQDSLSLSPLERVKARATAGRPRPKLLLRLVCCIFDSCLGLAWS